MSKRNRLESYRNHAKEGKLDNNQSKSTHQNPDVNTPLEKEDTANSANTQRDSAGTDPFAMISVLQHFLHDVQSAGQSHKEPHEIMQLLQTVCRVYNYDTEYLCISDRKDGTMISAFNPWYKKCGCEACVGNVARIKDAITRFDEVGAHK